MAVTVRRAPSQRQAPGASGILAGVRQVVGRVVLPALVVLALASGVIGCGRARKDRPFTRAGVLAELRDRVPGVSLPPDEAVPGVESRLDLPYARRDGRDLLLDVFMPTGAGPYPGVIVVHGGAWKSGDRAMERPLARQLAARGFVTATVGYRLGTDGRFPNALFDLKAAVRWLRWNAVPTAVRGTYRRRRCFGGWTAGRARGRHQRRSALRGRPRSSGRRQRGRDERAGRRRRHRRAGRLHGRGLAAKENRNAGAPTQFLGGGFADRAETWRAASALFHVGPEARRHCSSTAPVRHRSCPAGPRCAIACARSASIRDRRLPGNAASVLAGQPLVHPHGRRRRAPSCAAIYDLSRNERSEGLPRCRSCVPRPATDTRPVVGLADAAVKMKISARRSLDLVYGTSWVGDGLCRVESGPSAMRWRIVVNIPRTPSGDTSAVARPTG